MTSQTGKNHHLLRRAVAGSAFGASRLLVGIGSPAALAQPETDSQGRTRSPNTKEDQAAESPTGTADEVLAIIARDYDLGCGRRSAFQFHPRGVGSSILGLHAFEGEQGRDCGGAGASAPTRHRWSRRSKQTDGLPAHAPQARAEAAAVPPPQVGLSPASTSFRRDRRPTRPIPTTRASSSARPAASRSRSGSRRCARRKTAEHPGLPTGPRTAASG